MLDQLFLELLEPRLERTDLCQIKLVQRTTRVVNISRGGLQRLSVEARFVQLRQAATQGLQRLLQLAQAAERSFRSFELRRHLPQRPFSGRATEHELTLLADEHRPRATALAILGQSPGGRSELLRVLHLDHGAVLLDKVGLGNRVVGMQFMNDGFTRHTTRVGSIQALLPLDDLGPRARAVKKIDGGSLPLRLHDEIEAGVVEVALNGLLPFLRARFDQVTQYLDVGFGQFLPDAIDGKGRVAAVVATASCQASLPFGQLADCSLLGQQSVVQRRLLSGDGHRDAVCGAYECGMQLGQPDMGALERRHQLQQLGRYQFVAA